MEKIKICWLGKKYKRNFVCFIPLTIDGVGKTADAALRNLEEEANKIIGAIKRAGIECNFSIQALKESIKEQRWWRNQEKQDLLKEGRRHENKNRNKHVNQYGTFGKNCFKRKYGRK